MTIVASHLQHAELFKTLFESTKAHYDDVVYEASVVPSYKPLLLLIGHTAVHVFDDSKFERLHVFSYLEEFGCQAGEEEEQPHIQMDEFEMAPCLTLGPTLQIEFRSVQYMYEFVEKLSQAFVAAMSKSLRAVRCSLQEENAGFLEGGSENTSMAKSVMNASMSAGPQLQPITTSVCVPPMVISSTHPMTIEEQREVQRLVDAFQNPPPQQQPGAVRKRLNNKAGTTNDADSREFVDKDIHYTTDVARTLIEIQKGNEARRHEFQTLQIGMTDDQESTVVWSDSSVRWLISRVVLQDPMITCVDLSNSNLSNMAAIAVIQALHHNPYVTSLLLHQNQLITDLICYELAVTLTWMPAKGSPIKVMNLSMTGVGDGGIAFLLNRLLEGNTTLEILDLRGSQVSRAMQQDVGRFLA
eukprot:PhF_6_TR21152/c0_g1_i2/m.30447